MLMITIIFFIFICSAKKYYTNNNSGKKYFDFFVKKITIEFDKCILNGIFVASQSLLRGNKVEIIIKTSTY